jgi:L-ascorbate metabolism protein UlaG (beta-lactamase superfamily)
MRNLENIDLAFLCMNLPYTMTPEAAADATLAFKPRKVMPYHYRGAKDGETYYFDVKEFKDIVNKGDGAISVELLEWYPTM